VDEDSGKMVLADDDDAIEELERTVADFETDEYGMYSVCNS